MHHNTIAALIIIVGTFGCTSYKDMTLKQEADSTPETSAGIKFIVREADRIIKAHQTPFEVHKLRLQEASEQPQETFSEFLINRPDIANLPLGLSPAYLLGDVNEDGSIDKRDLQQVRKLLKAEAIEPAYRSVSCVAAADLDFDGNIDSDDVLLLEEFIQEGATSSGFLYEHTILPCNHNRSFVAFSQEPVCQDPLQARLLPFTPLRGIRLDESSHGTLTQSDQLPGWQFTFNASLLVSGSPAIVFTQAGNFFIYELSNFCALQPSKELSEKDWGITSIPTGEQTGRPLEYGSDIDNLQVCPQETQGCEALILDFLANSKLWQEPGATATKNALTKAGCNVIYVAPTFVKIPPKPAVRTYTPTSYSSFSKANQLNRLAKRKLAKFERTLSKVLTGNRLSWRSINNKIATYRSKLRAGAALAYQLVNAHGSTGSGGTCGQWGVGFHTGTGTLSREQFHRGNYRAERKNVCNAVMEDRSCHSGLSANALDWLNNFSLVSCGSPPRENHRRHAAFYGNMVMTTAEAPNVCTMANIMIRDYITESYINRAKKDAGYRSLAQAFLVRGIGLGQNASGYYTDNGYNRIPGKLCKGASRRY